jgi:hypothetical protein
MRNIRSGALELYDISNNQITAAFSLGTIGTNWQFAGIGAIGSSAANDLVLRDANTGAFEVYDIANNAITSAADLGSVGLDWQVGGIAVDPPTGSPASMGGSVEVSQLAQAMAGFGGDGAADRLNVVAQGSDALQQAFLTAPQHG